MRLAEPEAAVEPRERPRGPPVEIAQEPHRRGHDQRAHERGVDRDRDRHPEADRLDDHDVSEREREEDADHDGGGTGDDPADLLEALGDGVAVVVRAVVLLLHPAEEQDLVVHR